MILVQMLCNTFAEYCSVVLLGASSWWIKELDKKTEQV